MSINYPRVLTIADLYRLNSPRYGGKEKPVAATTCATTQPRLPCMHDGEFTATRSTIRAYISLSPRQHVKATVHDRCIGANDDRGITDGRQRRDISNLEIGQWPCALKPYVLILLNLAKRSCRSGSSTARLFHAIHRSKLLVKISDLFPIKYRCKIS